MELVRVDYVEGEFCISRGTEQLGCFPEPIDFEHFLLGQGIVEWRLSATAMRNMNGAGRIRKS